jgi:5-(carboxyamino)imidazole ribonucleotide mutase
MHPWWDTEAVPNKKEELHMSKNVVILGSQSDKTSFDDVGFTQTLRFIGISYEVSIMSVYRNLDEIKEYCSQRDLEKDTVVLVGIAGMSAALPGIMAAIVPSRPIMGVPLPSDGFSHAGDAILSMYRMPLGKPVSVCNFANAALFAFQIVAVTNSKIRKNLDEYLLGMAHGQPIQICVERSA